MGPPSCRWSVVDRNVVMWRIPAPVMLVSRIGAPYRRVDNVGLAENVSGGRREILH